MCGVFVLSANTPIYLSSHLKLEPREMGLVTSAIGFGGFAGLWILPALSDFFGRRPMAVVGFLGGALSLVGFINTGAEPLHLFGWLFFHAPSASDCFRSSRDPFRPNLRLLG